MRGRWTHLQHAARMQTTVPNLRDHLCKGIDWIAATKSTLWWQWQTHCTLLSRSGNVKGPRRANMGARHGCRRVHGCRVIENLLLWCRRALHGDRPQGSFSYTTNGCPALATSTCMVFAWARLTRPHTEVTITCVTSRFTCKDASRKAGQCARSTGHSSIQNCNPSFPLRTSSGT